MRVIVFAVTFVSLFLPGVLPVQASEAQPPGQKADKYVRWYYPAQTSYGPIETGAGDTSSRPAPGAFLTLPFMGPHIVTALFDHCYPDYGTSGRVCRYDGAEASVKVGGPDPTFDAGYAQTPGGHDYLYYDGHDGYDYALTYEPVAAAAPGTVIWANWLDPNCHTCLSGLTVEINHGNGLLSFYGHLSRIDVAKGQRVRRGQVIGISGSTGTATGPHLHFGVYVLNHSAPSAVDPYGWSGSGPDPWSLDRGDLWLSGSPRFADVPLPSVTVTAQLDGTDPNAIDVSWSSPGDGNRYKVYVVSTTGAMTLWNGNTGPGSAVFHGTRGLSYWFWASVTTGLGWTDASGSPLITVPRGIHGEVQ
ncbi:MAG TPA: M23 family metallopeptidase [Candidatus Dormibacteraeota bacterium]|jgi:murein DD-endopeptidase MepM/ murein hydrolase activator NlpD